MIDQRLLEVLRCPLHPEGPVMNEQEDLLICSVCGKAYPVVDGIPHLLIEDGIDLAATEPKHE